MKQISKIISSGLLTLVIFCTLIIFSKADPLPFIITQVKSNLICSSGKLKNQFEEIAKVTQGPVGVSVIDLETGKTINFNADQKFPMQSVYKFPIAMAVLEQVDSGTLHLEQKVSFNKSDFVSERQHSPIRGMYPAGGELSLKELLQFMVSESDGSACDILLRVLGGPELVTRYLHQLGIKGIAVETTEKEMASDENVQYRNWSKPKAMAQLLRILYQGKKGLSAPSRALLLELMTETETGPNRIKGMLPANTVVAHKTGSSGTAGGITRATNDVGLVSLPSGKHFAIAVFVSDTKADERTQEEVIAKITRATWDCFVR